MGEISEMMLDGTLCQVCGVYLGPSPDECETYMDQIEAKEWESCGYPISCEDCR